jgi:ABC-type oligopeptide transport system ATPase subunit
MKNSLIAGKPIHMRDVSLDKKIIKEHKFGLLADQKEKEAKEILKEKVKDVSLPQAQHNRYP